MSTDTKIRLENVNLHYSSVAFKERSLKTMVTAGIWGKGKSPIVKDIHALKNINLAVSSGERIGLIGHNGAGKSTFLKMLAGLYPISSGSRMVKGDIQSLFDLSLGFEQEATGRENILYRGLLLGMSPKFMASIESNIVAFADIGEFIDYPIKTYSAGMQVRLAFAISTMIGGDVLLLDEVIGAGDAEFMVRAKARIMELIAASEILILASHDLSSLRSLCTRGLVFHHGEIRFDGDIEDSITAYKNLIGLDEITP